MHELMKHAWLSWADTRDETLAFVKSLSKDQLARRMPRPGLNTFGMHFHELGVIQKAFAAALRDGRMDYRQMSFREEPDLESDRDRLLAFLYETDRAFLGEVEGVGDPLRIVDWDLPHNPTALEHVFWLMQHETFHHGQLVAFCYVMDVPIPQALSQHWNMPPLARDIVKAWIKTQADEA